MKEEILKSLKNIEKQHDVKILYACESGSRAWGFPSADSDYDVRFIYVHNLQWYLSLDDKKDTNNTFLPNDLDMSGWEVRKALTHFSKSNISLYEWFYSPIVYFELGNFCSEIKKLIPKYFNQRKAIYHYCNLANTALQKHLEDGFISVKKLMYVLRSYLACEWIQQEKTMPPTLFKEIYKKVASAQLQNEINDLINTKINLTEHSKIKPFGAIKDFLTESAKYSLLAQEVEASTSHNTSSLNNIIFDLIK